VPEVLVVFIYGSPKNLSLCCSTDFLASHVTSVPAVSSQSILCSFFKFYLISSSLHGALNLITGYRKRDDLVLGFGFALRSDGCVKYNGF